MIQQQNEKILEQIDKSGELIVRHHDARLSAFCATGSQDPKCGNWVPWSTLCTAWDRNDGEDL